MKHFVILTFVVALVSFCVAQTPTQPMQYFPSDALFHRSEQEKGYIAVLERFKEPVLLQESEVSPKARVYRLLWSGALAYESPIVVRLNVDDDGTGLLTLKINDKRNGQPGKIHVTTRKISKQKIERFLAGVQKLDFTNEPADDPHPFTGFDGTDWLLECVENGSYRMFLRTSPEKGPVVEIGRMLSRLSGENFIR